ncbi:MAG: PQQ-binding-like beta-propeller repeat protein [Verrucomicrobiota bacterium]
MNCVRRFVWVVALLAASKSATVLAGDWPQWRYDARRSADSEEKLPAQLVPAWSHEYSPRTPAWEDPLNQDLMPFDAGFEPIVLGDRLVIGFNDRDKVVALDTQTGREAWSIYTEGPVRLAPVGLKDKVYFVSDDGFMYCVKSADGALVWKFRGGPSDRKALGNGRLVSAWPARGGPVIQDGVLYFAASIWPFMGTYIYALDAETGKVVWVNDGTGANYTKQPHMALAFSGVAPQGALVATEKYLLVPGSRSVPAVFDRLTGKLLYYHLADSGKGNGGSFVIAGHTNFFVHTRGHGMRAFDLATGKKGTFTINEPVLGASHYYCAADFPNSNGGMADASQKLDAARYGALRAKSDYMDAVYLNDTNAIKRLKTALGGAEKKLSAAEATLESARKKSSTNAVYKVIQAWKADKTLQWELKGDGSGDLIRAKNVLYAGGSNVIIGVQMPARAKPGAGAAGAAKPTIVWTQPIEGKVWRLLAANGMLFAVTQEGHILAFGASAGAQKVIKDDHKTIAPDPATVAKAQSVLTQSGVKDGYALCLGLDEDDLLPALADASKLQIIGVDADAAKVDRLRRRFDAAGLYGTRISLIVAAPESFGAPPYFASVMFANASVSAKLADEAVLHRVYESLRPYGGVLLTATGGAELAEKVKSARLAKAQVKTAENGLLIKREGALPGAANWTHQYGDAANSMKSDDQNIKLPVGVLWFGGNTHMDVLPRHGHGPSEQVVGGRLILEGMDCVSARDVYTGRRLWKTVIPGLDTTGIYHNETYIPDPLTTLYNQKHFPGANARGANFVATEDAIYVAVSNHCVVVNAVTGEILRTITLPAKAGQPAPQWGFLAVSDNVLLGGAEFGQFNKRFGIDLSWPPPVADFSASLGLVAFDRHTGTVLWQTAAKHSFIHNGIAIGNGRVYCLDRLPKNSESKYKLHEGKAAIGYRIAAFDLRSGQTVWQQSSNIFGSWLSYSKEHDVLLHAGAAATDRLKDEAGQGMMVLSAKDGSVVWKRSDLRYTGPCILYHDLILTTPTSYKLSAGAFRLLDGKPHTITNALTGAVQPWRIYRTYGCSTPVAAEHLMTFRSGAAGYYDLDTHSGTGNLGGFKSACSFNLIVADGVLNAPDYTRTCSCPYQNQTSLGLIPMPEMEMWTCNYSGLETKEGDRIQRVGINLGAPGDRRVANGTLWLEYPANSGISPRLPVTFEMSATNVFRHHSSAVTGDGPAWVFASGLRDLQAITIRPQMLKQPPLPAAPKVREGMDDDDEDENATHSTHGSGSTNEVSSSSETNAVEVLNTSKLPDLKPARYTVRLYFMEPDAVQPGERVFDVALQGKPVLKAFDVLKAAGGVNRGLVKEFPHIEVHNDVRIQLTKVTAAQGPILSGVELILEDH